MATMVSSRSTALIVTGESGESAARGKPTVNLPQSCFGYRTLGNKPWQKEAGVLAVFCEGGAEFLR